MKHLLLIALTFFLFSCSDKKAVIVEQIKAYKDSMGVVNKREAVLLDEIMAAQGKYIGQQSLDTVNAIESRQATARASITVDRFRFQAKIDSLELELKKY
jgi:hypothetical protein